MRGGEVLLHGQEVLVDALGLLAQVTVVREQAGDGRRLRGRPGGRRRQQRRGQHRDAAERGQDCAHHSSLPQKKWSRPLFQHGRRAGITEALGSAVVSALLAVSDLHVGYAENREVVKQLRPHSDDDWLLVAGGLGPPRSSLAAALGGLAAELG